MLAFEDLYGSKLHAALDRWHPRDLFDIIRALSLPISLRELAPPC